MTARFIAAAALLAVTAGSALAADLPTRKPAPVYSQTPMAYNWTGFSLGVQGGWMGGSKDAVGHFSNLAAYPSYNNLGNVGVRGGFVGLRAGYDWQAAGSPLVMGVAGDVNYSGAKRSISGLTVDNLAYSARSKSTWDGSARLRAGYAIDRTLIYVTGGVAFAGNDYRLTSSTPTLSAALSKKNTYVGGTVGAGLQYAITNNLALGLEYRYTTFGSKKLSTPIVNGAGVGVGTLHTTASPDNHRVLATLDYRF